MSKYKQLNFKGIVIFEHRLIMEQHLGRALQTNEHVHHLNGNPLDNRIENLALMSKSEHHKHHLKVDKKRIIEASKKQLICSICGVVFRGNWKRTICFSHECLKHRNRVKAQKWYHDNIEKARQNLLRSYYKNIEKRHKYNRIYMQTYQRKDKINHSKNTCPLTPSS